MRTLTICAMALCLATTGCKKDDDGGGSDTDGGTVTDTGTSTGDSGTSAVQCDDAPNTPPPGSGPAACLTAELACGDSVTHSTTGGTTDLSAGYTTGAWACNGSDPLTADYSGPERRYWITAPDGVEPVLTLTSGCDLSMKVVRLNTPCPTDSSQVDCSDADGDYNDRVQTYTLFPGLSYEVIIESVNGGEGAFTLDVSCP